MSFPFGPLTIPGGVSLSVAREGLDSGGDEGDCFGLGSDDTGDIFE